MLMSTLWASPYKHALIWVIFLRIPCAFDCHLFDDFHSTSDAILCLPRVQWLTIIYVACFHVQLRWNRTPWQPNHHQHHRWWLYGAKRARVGALFTVCINLPPGCVTDDAITAVIAILRATLVQYTADDINAQYAPPLSTTTRYQPTLLHAIVKNVRGKLRYSLLMTLRDDYHMNIQQLATIPFPSNNNRYTLMCACPAHPSKNEQSTWWLVIIINIITGCVG